MQIKQQFFWILDDGVGPYIIRSDHGHGYRDPLRKTDQVRRKVSIELDLNDFFEDPIVVRLCPLQAGQYHPRIYRPRNHPLTEETYAHSWSDSVKSVRSILVRLEEAFLVVEPHHGNTNTFGHEFRQLLILACTEVESACKAILVANGYPAPTNGRWQTSDYVKLIKPLYLNQWEVALTRSPRYPSFAPFRAWDIAKPTKSLDWYNAYNITKHDRENHLHDATLERAIHAAGAAYALTVAQFGQFGFKDSARSEIDTFRVAKAPNYSFEDHYIPPDPPPAGKWVPCNYSF